MDKQSAIRLISDTFSNPFDEFRFTTFIKNLLNHIDESKAFSTLRGNLIKDKFEEHIRSYKRIGTYIDPDGLKVDLMIVWLQKQHSLEHARTMQRNFMTQYLLQRDQKDAALVAYVAEDPSDWRFSLVRMDYQTEVTESGKVKVINDLTPARRYSFLVGKNEPNHTAQKQFFPILQDTNKNPTLEDLEEIFNIEKVTDEFFYKYRDLFIRIKGELDNRIIINPKVKLDFESKKIDTVNFAKKLLGQIIFLYFLQKKGWFGVPRDADWGNGSKHFLRELFDKKHGSYENFFDDVLEPLFYEVLRNDRSYVGNYYSQFKCKIPFLNGGLFDPINNYDWVNSDGLLSNSIFSNITRTKEGDIGDGILDIFDRYNFTVKEDEPFEKEVAIDPELLGKAYEKFNAIRSENFDNFLQILKNGKKGEEGKFNKQHGVYYTPREIVHSMCQQSLIFYLSNELESIINKNEIESFIKFGVSLYENEERVAEKGRETTTYIYKLPSIKENAELIDKILENIKICDPAVGSGAFPVGMMSEIIHARNILGVYLKNRKSLYDLKRNCIENALFGVDIDEGAVEITKLRLWLSLIVDEDDIKNIKPLPNLDYKIVCGNSLIGFPDNWGSSIEKEIESLINLHVNETNPLKKEKYKTQIDEKINIRYKNSSKVFGYQISFDFRTVFSEVFNKKNGFDIVIGNPPYINAKTMQKTTPHLRKILKNNYHFLSDKWDIYIAFIEKGIKLTSKSSIITLIIPNAFVKENYAKKIREYLIKNQTVRSISFFEYGVFDAAVNNIILVLQKNKATEHIQTVYKTPGIFSTKSVTSEKIFISSSNELERLLDNDITLGDVCFISVGMVLNANELVSKGEFIKDDLISESEDNIHCKPYTEAKWIDRYKINKIKYLEWGTCRVPSKIRRATFPELYEKEKILVNKLGKIKATYDNNHLFCDQTIRILIKHDELLDVDNNSISISIQKFTNKERRKLCEISHNYQIKYILALLNSSLYSYLLDILRTKESIDINPLILRKLPMPKAPMDFQEKIVLIVDEIMKNNDCGLSSRNSVLETQLEKSIFTLFELNESEINLIENSFKR